MTSSCYYIVDGQVVRVLALRHTASDPQAREATVRGRIASDSDE